MAFFDKNYKLQELYAKLPPYVKGHSARVALYMQIFMAELLRSSPDLCPNSEFLNSNQQIVFARECGFYHDIGKMTIPRAILLKHGKLTLEEYEIVKTHPQAVQDLLAPFLEVENYNNRKLLMGVIRVASTHHERWDGKGYPMGLTEKEIPLLGRMCALADSYEAMTSRRTYSGGFSHKRAITEIERCGGSQFDPELTQVFLSCSHDLEALLESEPVVYQTGVATANP